MYIIVEIKHRSTSFTMAPFTESETQHHHPGIASTELVKGSNHFKINFKVQLQGSHYYFIFDILREKTHRRHSDIDIKLAEP